MPAAPHVAARNRQRTGPRHPRWKGDLVAPRVARNRAIYRYPARPCQVCGQKPIPGTKNIHRHHRDFNVHNDLESNIAFLCRGCHTAVHRAHRVALKQQREEIAA